MRKVPDESDANFRFLLETMAGETKQKSFNILQLKTELNQQKNLQLTLKPQILNFIIFLRDKR